MAIDFEISNSKKIKGLKIIRPSIHIEDRGEIWSSYSKDLLGELLPENILFKHDKFSTSKKNVLRGIHGDDKSWKMISCIQGSIMQVVVDMRKTSETFLKWESFKIGDDNRLMILIPPNFGNAFLVLSEIATYHYKLAYEGKYFDVEDQFTIPWNDPRVGIRWPVDNPILSNRDKNEKI